MDLQHWQAQFENWLKNHHQHQDAAHDVCHFRRVWATAQKLAADDDVDMLVILTACYFHDIVSGENRGRLSCHCRSQFQRANRPLNNGS